MSPKLTDRQRRRRQFDRRVIQPILQFFRRQTVCWGTLRRLSPMSRRFALDRGTPIDRYFINQFLTACSADVKGRVLEIGENTYTKQFGGDRVTRSEVLHAVAGNRHATIVGDLTKADNLDADSFDCLILTQTLLCIYDLHSVIRNMHRILKPGGVALVTIPGISQISRYDMDRWGDFWRFTDLSARTLFEESFPAANITITTHGNVLVATAFLHGMAAEELSRKELSFRDADYQVSIMVRAVK